MWAGLWKAASVLDVADASAPLVIHDDFTGSGALNNTEPDTVSNGNTWGVKGTITRSGSGYITNSGSRPSNPGADLWIAIIDLDSSPASSDITIDAGVEPAGAASANGNPGIAFRYDVDTAEFFFAQLTGLVSSQDSFRMMEWTGSAYFEHDVDASYTWSAGTEEIFTVTDDGSTMTATLDSGASVSLALTNSNDHLGVGWIATAATSQRCNYIKVYQ